MSSYAINLNLLKLKNTAVIDIKSNKTGEIKKCLIIPVVDNDLYQSERGVYIGLNAYEANNLKDEKTHLVKQNHSKEVREKMSEDDRANLPILGDAKPIVFRSEPANINTEEYNQAKDALAADDLPF
ncbi:hypothetical protein [Parabacteroides sp.]